ncbi:MAG: ABC transporter substrate-binding protein, partial [Deltaproteobacteria bacterium]|nr:ABC transporter substrate-binding protein [Deltaproteobacteria bacterium]
TDLLGPLRRARSAGARALLVSGYLEESIRTARVLRQIGWRPDAFFATVGPTLPAYRKALGAAADGTLSSSQWVHHERLPIADSARFARDFTRAYGEPPSYQAASAYAAGQILAAAIRSAGAVDRERVRDALATLNFTSLIGRYGVDQSGRQIRHSLLVLQWQRGSQEVVGPAELRTAPPLLGGGAEARRPKSSLRGKP